VWNIAGGQCREVDCILIPANAGHPIAAAAFAGSSFAILTDRSKLLIYQ
jgi:hypothetical protein